MYNIGVKNLKKKCLVFLLSSFFLCALNAQPKPGKGQPSPPGKGAPPPKGGAGPAPVSPRNKNNSHSKDSLEKERIIKYRGERLSVSEEPFVITGVNVSRSDNATVSLELKFNRNINPKTVSPYSIKINGESLPENARFSFNRKGDTVKVSLLQEKNEFSLEVNGITSYEGVLVETAEFYEVINEDSGS